MTAVPRDSGTSVRPACSGEKRSPSWKNSDVTITSPAKPAKNASPTSRPDVYARLRSRLGAIIGVPCERRSATAKTPMSARPAAMRPNVHSGQPSSRPWTRG